MQALTHISGCILNDKIALIAPLQKTDKPGWEFAKQKVGGRITWVKVENLVTNLSPNLVTNWVITKLGDILGDIFGDIFGDILGDYQIW